MADELELKLGEEVQRREGLLRQLAPRRAAEARALERLRAELATLGATHTRLEATRASALRERERLSAELATLARGLSPLRRYWAKAGEPVSAATLFLVAAIAVGLSPARAGGLALALAAALAGFLVGRLVRR